MSSTRPTLTAETWRDVELPFRVTYRAPGQETKTHYFSTLKNASLFIEGLRRKYTTVTTRVDEIGEQS